MPPSIYRPVDVAEVYRHMFPARHDVYQHWVVGPDPENPIGWRPVREEMTAEVVLTGLAGPGIGGYMIHPGSTSHVVAVDFDTDDGLQQGYTLAGIMNWNGLPTYVETSRRGSHLWCVLDEVLPAVAIRFALRALLAESGLPTNDPHIELRPGSDHVEDDGLGHALRLPFMPHPKTGQRGTMIGPDGPVAAHLSAVILDWQLAPASVLHDWSMKWIPPTPRVPDHFRPPRVYPEETSTASEILASLWGVPNARANRSVRCPAHDDRHASLNIFPDDQRAMCMAGGCVLNNNDHGRGTYELRTLAEARTRG